MTEAEIYQQLTPLFRETFDNDEIALTPQLSAADVEEWDSLSNIRLIVAAERQFGVRFSTSEISSFQNVGDFVGSISAKLGN